MTIKQKSFRERDKDDQKGKRKYIERLAQDEEAAQEINEFLEGKDDEHRPNDSDSVRLLWK